MTDSGDLIPAQTVFVSIGDVPSLPFLGDSVQTLIKWDDAAKTLSIEPASKKTGTRTFQVELIPDGGTKEIQYNGQPLELKF